jgi:hypothetical protein
MSTSAVTVVRVYLMEHEGVDRLVRHLHDETEVQGVTVFRGIGGFGRSRKTHGLGLVDLSLDLPVVVEFYDDPARAEEVVELLKKLVDPHHILLWPAQICDNTRC